MGEVLADAAFDNLLDCDEPKCLARHISVEDLNRGV